MKNAKHRAAAATPAAVQACALPKDALLHPSLRAGAYVDCYVTEVARPVAHADYVEAFYTTKVFKLERFVLAAFAARSSTDLQARALANGALNSFAVWKVEARANDQLLLSDFRRRTRSWLMVASAADGRTTKLFFGSAVMPINKQRSGKAAMGFAFRALLGFHELYSRVLLRAAASRLMRG